MARYVAMRALLHQGLAQRSRVHAMTTAMTGPGFTAAVAGLCGPGEAALVMICAEDGLSYCISSEEGAHESARAAAAGEVPVDEDVLLGVAVISRDGTLTEYPITGRVN